MVSMFIASIDQFDLVFLKESSQKGFDPSLNIYLAKLMQIKEDIKTGILT